MVWLVASLLILLMLQTMLAVLAAPESAWRAPASHMLSIVAFSTFVVTFAVKGDQPVLDRSFYLLQLRRVAGHSISHTLNPDYDNVDANEPLYRLIIWAISSFGTTNTIFYVAISLICLGLYLMPFRGALRAWQVAYVLILTVSMGILTSYTSIVIRQGIAMCLIFAGTMTSVVHHRSKQGAALTAAAALVHWSALPFTFVVLLGCHWTPRIKPLIGTWATAALIFIFGLQEALTRPIQALVPKYQDYTSDNLLDAYQGGVNRIEFLAVSVALGAVFLFIQAKFDMPEWYIRIVGIYCMLNILFLAFGNVYYSDRLAAYSWFFAPLLLAGPVYATTPSRLSRNLGSATLLGVGCFAFFGGPLQELAVLVQ